MLILIIIVVQFYWLFGCFQNRVVSNKQLALNGLEKFCTSYQVCCLCLSLEKEVTVRMMSLIWFPKNCSLDSYLDLSLAAASLSIL